MEKKIKMLVIPSDRSGCGYYRSVNPHQYIAENYSDEFDVDIVYQMPNGDLEKFLSQYDLIHIHKQLDKDCKIMDMIKFLGIPVIIDVDDNFKLGDSLVLIISFFAKSSKLSPAESSEINLVKAKLLLCSESFVAIVFLLFVCYMLHCCHI